MMRIVPILIVGIMVLSGLGAAAILNTTQKSIEKTETISFLYPEIQNKDGYALVTIKNTNAWLYKPDTPMLPASVTTYIFPFGTKIRTVDLMFSEPEEYTLENKIASTPKPVSVVAGKKITFNQEEQGIGSIYPETLFDYHLGAGISGEDHVIFLTVRCYPVQYKPGKNKILYRDTAHLSITYDLPTTEKSAVDDYKLVIIAPKDFSTALQPLVNHKISKGVTTKLVTRDDICDSVYFTAEGRDCAEEMKYFIKNAFDQWGTKYILLVGGRNGGIMEEKWWVPVRYTNLDDGANYEGGYLSDLYFADLYDAGGNFSSWDSNNNGIFAEWNSNGKDIIDMYPDISIGRLACINVNEVKILVNKIITYETTTAGKEWFKKMVVVGGDSAPIEGDPYYEGEEENKLALEYMTGFDGVRLWTSNGNFTGPQDVIDGISAGCGFLFFDGHGNPKGWSTHPPNNESAWISGLKVDDMPNLKNGAQLPVTVCGGCHNGQFNTSYLNIIKGILQDGLKYFAYKDSLGKFWYNDWIPECWAWKLISVKNGGSIATMAYTGLDWFAEGDYNDDGIPDCNQRLAGYTNTQFFKNYGVNNMTILGQAHSQALIDYLNAYPPMQEKLDCKTVQEFVLLGDPSLLIGGYPS
jgi:hypothetical protein